MTIYRHVFSGVLPAGDIFSFGWHDDTGLSLASAHNLASAWVTDLWNGVLLTPGIGGIMVPGCECTKVTTSQLNSAFPYQTIAVAATDLTLAGTSAGNSLPQDMSVVVSLRSATPGRKGRGRIYLPAPDTTTVTVAGELTTAAQTIYANALNQAWNDSNVGGTVPTIFSRTAGTSTHITSFGVGTVFDRQARRVNKVNTVRVFTPMP